MNDYKLSRNHDGDFLLLEGGRPTKIIAKAFSPEWFAIVDALSDPGRTGLLKAAEAAA